MISTTVLISGNSNSVTSFAIPTMMNFAFGLIKSIYNSTSRVAFPPLVILPWTVIF